MFHVNSWQVLGQPKRHNAVVMVTAREWALPWAESSYKALLGHVITLNGKAMLFMKAQYLGLAAMECISLQRLFITLLLTGDFKNSVRVFYWVLIETVLFTVLIVSAFISNHSISHSHLFMVSNCSFVKLQLIAFSSPGDILPKTSF